MKYKGDKIEEGGDAAHCMQCVRVEACEKEPAIAAKSRARKGG